MLDNYVDYIAHLQCMVTHTIYSKYIYIWEMSFSRRMHEYCDGYLPMNGFMPINHIGCVFTIVFL